MEIDITGLGIIFFSPSSVSHIQEDEDYFTSNFENPSDVSTHVTDCQISCFATGSPGSYILQTYEGDCPVEKIESSSVAIRLGLEVKDQKVIFRDLYDLMNWPLLSESEISLRLDNGYYLVTVLTNVPESGILGDSQIITLYFTKQEDKPKVNWPGVPMLIAG